MLINTLIKNKIYSHAENVLQLRLIESNSWVREWLGSEKGTIIEVTNALRPFRNEHSMATIFTIYLVRIAADHVVMLLNTNVRIIPYT